MRKFLLLLVLIALVAGCIGGGEQEKTTSKGFIATYDFISGVNLNMNGTLVPSSASETRMVVKQVNDRAKLSLYMKGSNTSLADSYITPEGNFTCRSLPVVECVKESNPPRPPTELGAYLKELEEKGHIVLKGTGKQNINGFECEEKRYEVGDIDAYLNYLNFNKTEAIPIDVDIDEVKMVYCEKDGFPVYYSSILNAVVNQSSARKYLNAVGTNESETPIPTSIVSNVTYMLISLEKDVEIPKEEFTPPTP